MFVRWYQSQPQLKVNVIKRCVQRRLERDIQARKAILHVEHTRFGIETEVLLDVTLRVSRFILNHSNFVLLCYVGIRYNVAGKEWTVWRKGLPRVPVDIQVFEGNFQIILETLLFSS